MGHTVVLQATTVDSKVEGEEALTSFQISLQLFFSRLDFNKCLNSSVKFQRKVPKPHIICVFVSLTPILAFVVKTLECKFLHNSSVPFPILLLFLQSFI